MSADAYFWGTGRRKTAVAQVRIRPGTGKILVNDRQIEAYFTEEQERKAVVAPLEATEKAGKLDVVMRIKGGGLVGQAGAALLGVARALGKMDPNTIPKLRELGLLTRDSRMKERKKYGRHGARRGFQFSKR
ncbi:MAG: 30S ribosomal protein S9 [Planctomycetota bacterium]